jgi:hypothetical protein
VRAVSETFGGQLDGTRNKSLQDEIVCGMFWPSEMPRRKF